MKTKNLVLNDLLKRWVREGLYTRKPATNEKYQRLIVNHIKDSIGKISLSALSGNDINRFLFDMSVSGSANHTPLSPSYVRTIAFIIKSALKYGVNMHLCRPIHFSVKQPPKLKSVVEILSVDESVILTDFLLSDIDDKKLGTLLSLHLGLRIGEVCGLKWSDFDFDKKTVHIQRSISRLATNDADRKSVLSVTKVKSNCSDRIIPLPDYLINILSDFSANNYEYIVKGSKYPYCDPRTLRNALDSYFRTSNIPRVKFHSLRHTFATRCIEYGMDVKTLSELLGHSNISITLDLYVHSTIDHKRQQIENVSILYQKLSD